MYSRTIAIIGEKAFAHLQEARIILFGVGGVGGWCAEALVRTGVQHLTIVDFDVVSDSNRNRQVVATSENIGLSKAQEMQRRLLQIQPQADICCMSVKYDASTASQFDLASYDYVVDAIDSVECKALLIYNATRVGARVLSSMGAGRKMDPQQIRVAEFWKVNGCPLARALRGVMKKQNLLPSSKFLCVYSPEISAQSGTLAPIVGCFGMTLASLVIQDITEQIGE